MKTSSVIVVVVVLCCATAALDDRSSVTGFGGYPISDTLTSMWLVGPSGRPLLMAYFSGTPGWHNTQWQIASRFNKEKPAPGWAELKSNKSRLRLWMDAEAGAAEVQAGKFNVHNNNTFLVVGADEGPGKERIIPLGVFDLQRSGEQPASVLLLKANPALKERIYIEAAAR